MDLLIRLVINAFVIFVAAYILPGVHVDNLLTALIVAVVMGAVNMFIKPIVVALTLPITIITLGLFLFVINAVLILIVDYFVPGFSVNNFLSALLFSLIVSLLGSFLNKAKFRLRFFV